MTRVITALVSGTLTLFASQATLATMTMTVTVSVVSADQRPIPGLKVEDFAAELDGQAIVVESVTEGLPSLSVAFLVDRSGSMDRPRPFPLGTQAQRARETDQARKVLQRGLLDERRPGDVLFLGTLGGVTEWHGPFRPGVDELAAPTVLARPEKGHSPIWDAVVTAIPILRPHPSRKMMVLITDGKVTGARLSLEEAALQLNRDRVAVSVIHEGPDGAVKQEDDSTVVLRTERALKWLTEATGGHYVRGSTQRILLDIDTGGRRIAQVIDLHRRAYDVALKVPTRAVPQALRIRVKNKDLSVHAPAFIQTR